MMTPLMSFPFCSCISLALFFYRVTGKFVAGSEIIALCVSSDMYSGFDHFGS